jgi:hypothetical protein
VERRWKTPAGLVAVSGAIVLVTVGSAVASRITTFTVSSTLSNRQALPHRIHWLAGPSLPPSKIREVDFLIDGRRSWVEHSAPYTYGYDGNYLVTSWMRPGRHTFTVVAVATDGRRATISTRAVTSAPGPPPTALAGSWQRRNPTATQGSAEHWILTVSQVGWRILDPGRQQGALIDVAYLSPALLEACGGIATRDHDSRENNPWCDEPFEPVRYGWQADADRLTLKLAGPPRCDGQSRVLAGEWTRR